MDTGSQTITAAIVGAGLMGRWHAAAIKKAGGRVLAIVDKDEDAAGKLARDCGGARTFVDLEQIASAPDIVHVCSPMQTHYAIAESAIKMGCHLLVEKPMTPTASETERLFAMAAERRVILCPVHQFAFQGGVLKAKQLLPEIGTLIDINIAIASAGGSGLSGAELDTVMGDILPHPLSLLQLFLPNAFGRTHWTVEHPGNGELRALGEASGVSLFMLISMNARPTSNSLQLKGTRGTIHVNMFHGYSFVESGKVSRFQKMVQPFQHALMNSMSAALNLGKRAMRGEVAYPGLQRLIMSLYAAVRMNLPPPVSREEATDVAIVRDRLMKVGGLAFHDQEA